MAGLPLTTYAPTGLEPSRPAAKYLPSRPVHLPSPIEQTKSGRHVVERDRPLSQNPLDKLAYSLQTGFVRLPKAVWKGLSGSEDFNFSDFLLVSNIPYYLGGVMLTTGFLLGKGSPLPGIRQGVGVALYAAGMAASSLLINGLYQMRYGLDLGMKYRSASGRTEPVLSSHEFPYFDMIPASVMARLRKRMGIPDTVSDPDQAVREQLREMISESRTMKLVLGNLVAATGAGLIARSDHWGRIQGQGKALRTIWTAADGGHIGNRLSQTWTNLKTHWGPALSAQLLGHAQESAFAKWSRRVALGTIAASVGLAVFNILRPPFSKEYEAFKHSSTAGNFPAGADLNSLSSPQVVPNGLPLAGVGSVLPGTPNPLPQPVTTQATGVSGEPGDPLPTTPTSHSEELGYIPTVHLDQLPAVTNLEDRAGAAALRFASQSPVRAPLPSVGKTLEVQA